MHQIQFCFHLFQIGPCTASVPLAIAFEGLLVGGLNLWLLRPSSSPPKSVAVHPKHVYINEMLWPLLNQHPTVCTSPGCLLWKLPKMRESPQLDGHQGNLMVLDGSSSCTPVISLNAAPKDRASKSKITAPAQWLFCSDGECFRTWPHLKEQYATDDGVYHVEMSSC